MDEKDKERMRGIQWSQKDIDELVVGEHAPLTINSISEWPGRSAAIAQAKAPSYFERFLPDTQAQAHAKNLKARALLEAVSGLPAPKFIGHDLAGGPDETVLTQHLMLIAQVETIAIRKASAKAALQVGIRAAEPWFREHFYEYEHILYGPRRCICCGAPEGEVQHD